MAKEKMPCRYCKQPVNKGERRCPYCGTLNPTVRAKDAVIWTIGAIVVLYVAAWIMRSM